MLDNSHYHTGVPLSNSKHYLTTISSAAKLITTTTITNLYSMLSLNLIEYTPQPSRLHLLVTYISKTFHATIIVYNK